MRNLSQIARPLVIAALTVAVLVLAGCSFDGHVLDTSARSKIKTIAVLSVYGPDTIHAGLNSAIPEQDVYDGIHDDLTQGLKDAGYTVAPADSVTAKMQAKFRNELAHQLAVMTGRPLRGDSVDFLASFKGMLGATYAASSQGVDLTKYFTRRDETWTDSNTDKAVLQALAVVTAEFPADAFLVARAMPAVKLNLERKKGDTPSMRLQVEINSKENVTVFRTITSGQGENLGVSGFDTKYDPDKVKDSMLVAGKAAADAAVKEFRP